jgi:hypothetical protein
MILGEGIHRISMKDYLADPCESPSLSSGVIKTLLFDTPAKAAYEHVRLNPAYVEKTNGTFDIGTAAHSSFLEGIDNVCCIDADDWRTKAAKEARDNARAEGKVPLLNKHYADVLAMVNAAYTALAKSELEIVDLPFQGDSELTLIWKEDETWCKIRPDWLSKDYRLTINYKTTTTPNPNAFSRSVISFGYDIADAFYRRGIKAVTGIEPVHIFMVQSVEPPYLCSFIGLDPEFRAMGEAKVQQGIDVWRHCLRTGDWPGYPNRVMWLSAPPWSLLWQETATLPDAEGDL